LALLVLLLQVSCKRYKICLRLRIFLLQALQLMPQLTLLLPICSVL
jgi:hypothetical protein